MVSYLVKKNDIVDVIQPGTSINKEQIAAIEKYVKQKLQLNPRFLIKINEEIFINSDNEFPSYSAEMRFEELYQALKSDSKIIWCARGGYGSGDLLPFLAKVKKIKQNKIFIGFSDLVSITNFLQQEWGWQIICAPMLIQLVENAQENSIKELKNIIFGEKSRFVYQLDLINNSLIKTSQKQIESEIIGGCLSVVCGHFGGNYQIDFANKILFLEDEGEDGERLDRYLRQIIEVILKNKNKPQAILLGNFLQENLHGKPKNQNIKIAIERFIEKIARFNLAIPVFEGKEKNLGHSQNMRPLILGLKAKIDFKKLLLVVDNSNNF